jgi:hypothetical protein
MQAAPKLAGGEKWCAAFLMADTYWDWVQPGRVKIVFPQVRGPGCSRARIYLMLYLLLFAKRKKKKKRRELVRELFPRADTPYWLCHTGIFPADRYNQKIIQGWMFTILGHKANANQNHIKIPPHSCENIYY